MINKFQTTVVKVLINNKIRNYCEQNKISIGKTIRKAINEVYDMNPCIVFKRRIKLDSSVSVRMDYMEYEKYLELKEYLSGYGLGLLLYDYIINHETYITANQQAIVLNNSFIDKMSEIDKQIMKDNSLSKEEKAFLIELDAQSKEALYNDRELLVSVIKDSEI